MLAIVNADIDPVISPRIARGQVLMDGGKIRAVGKKLAIPARCPRYDAKGRLLTPGLMDAHSHAGLSEGGLPGDDDFNEKTDPVTPQVRAIDAFRPTDVALLEAAQAGVTSALIAPGSANVIGGMCAVVKTWGSSLASQIVRLDAGLKIAMGENPKKTYGELKRMPSTRMGSAAVMRQALISARTYIKKKAVHARSKKGEPFEIDLAKEGLAGLLEGRYPARCHAHRSIDMLTALRIADEFGFSLVLEHATECGDILGELRARKVPVVIGPTMSARSKIELRHKNWATVRQAMEGGLLVAITSDSPVTPLEHLAIYAALSIREGLDAADALKMLTINPATICGVADRLGAIAKGKDADLVLWDGDPFDARTRPAMVWVSGLEVDMEEKAFVQR
jgi:imidazolonepropionase-like amidohydrolase